jgi:hypothetical protein
MRLLISSKLFLTWIGILFLHLSKITVAWAFFEPMLTSLRQELLILKVTIAALVVVLGSTPVLVINHLK